jgi:hypothetical protein
MGISTSEFIFANSFYPLTNTFEAFHTHFNPYPAIAIPANIIYDTSVLQNILYGDDITLAYMAM